MAEPGTGLTPAQRELLLRRLAGKREAADGAPSRSLVPIRAAGARPPFFCVHAFGGGVNSLHRLAGALGDDRPFYGLQSRGLAGEAPPLRTVEEMAGHYLGEIRRVQPRGPYLLGGWCVGGSVAVEMARRLEAEGERVPVLALLATLEPSRQRIAARDDAELLADMVRENLALPLDGSGLKEVRIDELRRLPPERLARHALERLKEHGLVPRGYAPAAFQAYFDVYRANHAAFRGYAPAPYHGSVTLFLPEHEDATEVGDAYGWRGRAGALRVVGVPCTHGQLMKEPQVALLARALAGILAEAG